MYRTKMAEDKKTIVILIRVRKQGDNMAAKLLHVHDAFSVH